MMQAGGTRTEPRRRSIRSDEKVAVSAADVGGPADAGATTVTVRIPLAFRQRRGRKVLVAPDGAGRDPLGPSRSPALNQVEVTPVTRALARAFRWRKLFETGAVATVQEIAAAENINPSYVSRILRLTLFEPAIIEAMMAGVEGAGSEKLASLMRPFSVVWHRQAIADQGMTLFGDGGDTVSCVTLEGPPLAMGIPMKDSCGTGRRPAIVDEVSPKTTGAPTEGG